MNTVVAGLASIMVRPRATMRRILDSGRDRMIIPLASLAAASGFIGDLDTGAMRSVGGGRFPLPLLFAAMLVLAIVVFLVVFYLFSWAVYGIGRLLEGTGTPRGVRSAAAWGLTPAIWALLYRIPVAALWPQTGVTGLQVGSERWRINPGVTGMSCLGAVVVMVLEVTTAVWCAAVASNTIGEAHRFSSWRGFAAIVLTLISPALIALAAYLAS